MSPRTESPADPVEAVRALTGFATSIDGRRRIVRAGEIRSSADPVVVARPERFISALATPAEIRAAERAAEDRSRARQEAREAEREKRERTLLEKLTRKRREHVERERERIARWDGRARARSPSPGMRPATPSSPMSWASRSTS